MEGNMCFLPLASYKELDRVGAVYEIRHSNSSKPYIGRTIDLKDIMRKHHQELMNGKHKNPEMQNIQNKYGDEWSFNIIEYCNEEDGIELEDFILSEIVLKDYLNCHRNSNGGSRGQVWTDEQRANHSIVMKNKAPLTIEQRLKHKEAIQNSDAVKKHIRSIQHEAMLKAKSPEVRVKAVESRRLSGDGKFFSDETRQMQIDKAKDKAFKMITWISENKKTRDEGIKEFGSSWGSLKKWLPLWEETNGKLDLPLGAVGERNGLSKYHKSKQN